MRAYLAHTTTELRLALRQGEQLLVSLGIPLLLLLFFSAVDVLPSGDLEPVDFLVPGVLGLAVMGNAMVSLGIGTGFERSYGVLKRLATTPLGRPRLVAAKTTVVLMTALVQLVLVLALGALLGWEPDGGAPIALAAVLLGALAFAGIGLTLAGRLSGLANLAVTNALYLVLLLVGGMVFPLDELPAPLEAVARATPAAALSTVLRDALTGDAISTGALGVLVAWAVVAPVVAAATFRWEA
jgi:ABC-2 type transport system permease protein